MIPHPAGSPPLGARADSGLSETQLALLRKIEDYDLWFVAERLGRTRAVAPDRVARSVFEFRRYMALVGLGCRGAAMRSQEVDEVWHSFILFTREYQRFCEDVIGDFVHHAPGTTRAPVAPEGGENLLRFYERIFGPAPDLWLGGPGGGARGDCDSSSCGYVHGGSGRGLRAVGTDCEDPEPEPPLPPQSGCQDAPRDREGGAVEQGGPPPRGRGAPTPDSARP